MLSLSWVFAQILPGVRIIIANPETKGPMGESHLGEVCFTFLLKSDRLNWWGNVAQQLKLACWPFGVTSCHRQGETNTRLVIKLLLTVNVDSRNGFLLLLERHFQELTDRKSPCSSC